MLVGQGGDGLHSVCFCTSRWLQAPKCMPADSMGAVFTSKGPELSATPSKCPSANRPTQELGHQGSEKAAG